MAHSIPHNGLSPLAALMAIAANPEEDHGNSFTPAHRDALLSPTYLPKAAEQQPEDTRPEDIYQPDTFANWLISLLPQDPDGWYAPEKFELFVSLYQDTPAQLGCSPNDLKAAYGCTPAELSKVYSSMHSIKTSLIHGMITDLHQEALEMDNINHGHPRENETRLSMAIEDNSPYPSI